MRWERYPGFRARRGKTTSEDVNVFFRVELNWKKAGARRGGEKWERGNRGGISSEEDRVTLG